MPTVAVLVVSALVVTSCGSDGVLPAGSTAGSTVVADDAPETSAADTGAFTVFPWTFRGAGEIRVSAAGEWGVQGSSAGESTADFEIVLGADGSLSGSYAHSLGTNFGCDGDVVVEVSPWVFDLPVSGSHDLAGNFTMDTIWGEVTGTYDAESLMGRGSISEVDTPRGSDDCPTGPFLWNGEVEIEDLPRGS
jgi:hypothetical protein